MWGEVNVLFAHPSAITKWTGIEAREIDKQDRRSGRLKGGQGRWAGDEKEKEGESGCVCWALVAMSVII